jgi:pimeloyl-ACP methyl ester carboxylesterase
VAEGHAFAGPSLLECRARFLVDIIEKESEPVLLVGHSLGGLVIGQAADYVPRKIRGLVFLAAILPSEGATLWKAIRAVPRTADQRAVMTVSPDKKSLRLVPSAVISEFYHDAPEEWARRAQSLVRDEPTAILHDTPVLTGGGFGAIPRYYIECLKDRLVTIELQRKMLASLPCQRTISLDTGHCPFYSQPENLTQAILAVNPND